MEPENVRRWADVASCSIGEMAIVLFAHAPAEGDALAALRVLGDVAATHPKFTILTITTPNSKLIDAAVRDRMTREVKRVQKQIGAVATVIEGTGFGAAALRSAATAMTVVIRPEYPVKTFATVAQAAPFLAQHSTVRTDAIAAAVAFLRSRPT